MICPDLKSRQMLPNGIPRVCFYFCSTEWNSEHFSLPRNSLEQNSESLLIFLLHGTEFRAWFGQEFREFASIFVPLYRLPSIFLLHGMILNVIPRVFVPWKSRNSAGINQLFRLFRLTRNNFLSEIANPSSACIDLNRIPPSLRLIESF
jgi:hypothetical protein